MLGERLHGPLMHVVLETDVSAAAARRDRVVEDGHAGPDGAGRVVVVIQRVDVPHDDVVAQRGHVGEAAAVAVTIGRAHVRREEAEDIPHNLLHSRHLLPPVGRGEPVEVRVGEGVGGDLVALGVHPPQDIRVGRLARVAPVDAVDEEGGLGAVACEDVKELGGVDEGAVVEGYGDGSGDGACCDLDAYVYQGLV